MTVVYEDNHIIIINKQPGEIVQGDKTGDVPLSEKLKDLLKEKYNKPGNAFIGVVHRLDRPVGGLVIFAKTSKALSRLNNMLRKGEIHKTYRAIVRNCPPKAEDELKHFIVSNPVNNKSYVCTEGTNGAKEARLLYKVLSHGERFHLIEIKLLTGRKHQIRAQLSSIGSPIKGDLKYGDKRSNNDGSISLLATSLEFTHPVSGERIYIEAPCPNDMLWRALWI